MPPIDITWTLFLLKVLYRRPFYNEFGTKFLACLLGQVVCPNLCVFYIQTKDRSLVDLSPCFYSGPTFLVLVVKRWF